jgi:hypothetical protein
MAGACTDTFFEEFSSGQTPSSFNYVDFRNGLGLNLLKDASLDKGKLSLNTYTQYGISGCWYGRSKVAVATGFETTFQFNLSNPEFPKDVEGFAFVIQNAGSDSLGQTQYGIGNMGYESLANSLAVEFDTKYSRSSFNNGLDLDSPYFNHFIRNSFGHISIHSRGKERNSSYEQYALGTPAPLSVNLIDGKNHTAKIVYESKTLNVFIDGKLAKAWNVDLEDLLRLDGGASYVGFTASPTSQSERADILSWSFTPKSPQ